LHADYADYADFLFEVLIYDYNLVDEEKSGVITAKITFTPFTNSFGSEDCDYQDYFNVAGRRRSSAKNIEEELKRKILSWQEINYRFLFLNI